MTSHTFWTLPKGAAIEVQPLLYVAADVGYLNSDQFKALYRLADEVAALVGGFTSDLRDVRTSNSSE